MKIEIEMSEIEYLKAQIKNLEEQNREYRKYQEETNLDELKMRAIHLSWNLFNSYMQCVSEKLGVEYSDIRPTEYRELMSHLGVKWYEKKDRIVLKVCGKFVDKMKLMWIELTALEEPPKEEEYPLKF